MKNRNINLGSSILAFAVVSLVVGCTFAASEPQAQTETRSDEVLTDQTPAKPAAKPTPTKPAAKVADKTPAKAVDKAPAKAVAAARPAKPVITTSKTAAVNLHAPAAKAAEERVIRYVSADSLNVHASPRMDAQVVAKVRKGSMFTVSISGEWAKVSEGQYVLTKFLTRGKDAKGYKVAMGH